MLERLICICVATLALAWGAPAQALSAADAQALAVGDTDARIETLNRLSSQADAATQALIEALAADAVKVAGARVFIVREDRATDATTGQPATVPDDAEDVVNNNRMRSALEVALAALRLSQPDEKVRLAAAVSLQADPNPDQLPLVEKALAAETSERVRAALEQVRAGIWLGSEQEAERMKAAQLLATSRLPEIQNLLTERIAQESSPAVKAALLRSLDSVRATQAWTDRLGVAFTGVSLGSILLLAALGLAITYGLMGVINMAHGELIMIGAYATYAVHVFFRDHLPAWFDWYLLAAVPVAFAASALVGAAMERTVIRFLYGRPLETLLATWGISLILMQAVRTLFGAQNVGVENPVWMSGGWNIWGNLSLPWNRIVIIAFAGAVLLGMALLIGRTRLGLFVRGVTQNRPIASCMGVNTARVDTYAFALGSGVAGLAGCALSQIGNVGPDLGQGYIVDSFMVVVLGGVGQLIGTVYAALGLGFLNKLLEGWAGAVLAKIAVLVFIIVFIQKRPQGLFAMKGRSAEA
ncbi:urea ABC transporter permease subunit UrtB [Hydrogenophaga sp. OTU3427]|uniref:urea ABC transporter permease subunit UrtB n=1 Tax=Hydrogenophaga sp. OTU3427 TaxID=3043856 RepID=UPI00313B0B46